MRKLSVITFFIMAFALSQTDQTANGGIAGINISSETHHVWGNASGESDAIGYNPDTESYDYTYNVPVGGSASNPWYDAFDPEGKYCYYTASNPGMNHVYSYAGNFRVEAEDNSCWTFTGARAYAESTYTFTPEDTVKLLDIQFTGFVEMHHFENEVKFSLYDTTDAIEIDSYTWTTELSQGLPISRTMDYIVDPTHDYELKLHAHVWIGDTPGVTSWLTIIPEPSTFLLLGFGCLAFRKLTPASKVLS